MAVPATLPTVSEQAGVSASSSVRVESVRADASGAQAVSGGSSSHSACCPSIDSCLVRLEVAFMTRSDDKHQQLVSRLLLPLLNSTHAPAVCPLCEDTDSHRDRDREREADKNEAVERTESSRSSDGELDRENTASSASDGTSGLEVGSDSDGASRRSFMDSSSTDEAATHVHTNGDAATQQLHTEPRPQRGQQQREPCFFCRWRACQSSPPAVQCMETVLQTVTRVELAKALEGPVKAFQRHNTTGQPFREDVARVIDVLCRADEADITRLESIRPVTASNSREQCNVDHKQLQQQRSVFVKGELEECKEAEGAILYDMDENIPETHHTHTSLRQQESTKSRGCSMSADGSSSSSLLSSRSRRAVLAVTLLCCKFATENAPFNLRKSEIVKRKVRGLRLLLHLLQHVPHAYRCTRGGVMLLRRFVCPSLLTACITDVPIVFRLVLTIFRHLYDAAYRCHLLIELGALVDMMFLPLLESTHCTIQQKRDIVDTIAHCCGSSQQVVALYYNFDNRVPTWPSSSGV